MKRELTTQKHRTDDKETDDQDIDPNFGRDIGDRSEFNGNTGYAARKYIIWKDKNPDCGRQNKVSDDNQAHVFYDLFKFHGYHPRYGDIIPLNAEGRHPRQVSERSRK